MKLLEALTYHLSYALTSHDVSTESCTYALIIIVLYCIALHFVALDCIVLYSIVLYCIVLYCIVLYCIVLYCIVLYCIVLYCIVLCWCCNKCHHVPSQWTITAGRVIHIHVDVHSVKSVSYPHPLGDPSGLRWIFAFRTTPASPNISANVWLVSVSSKWLTKTAHFLSYRSAVSRSSRHYRRKEKTDNIIREGRRISRRTNYTILPCWFSNLQRNREKLSDITMANSLQCVVHQSRCCS